MILLTKNYKGALSGTIIQLQTSEEAALVAQGYATVSTGTPVAGAVRLDNVQGRVVVAAGATSVVVTNALVDASSKIYAVVAQATGDAVATSILRVVPAAGSFTIYTLTATADVQVDWCILVPSGLLASAH
jgi:hypothetical protein